MTRIVSLSRIASLLAVSGAMALSACSSTGSSSSAGAARSEDQAQVVVTQNSPRSASTRTGEVYLMRGLMDVFSRGMDVMAAKISRAGVYAVSTSYTEWRALADRIIARDKAKQVSYPIVIMGHSLGADDASRMATYLGNRGIRVSYVVMFDPTEPGYVGKNVSTVVNYYIPNGNNRVYKGSGFGGSLSNVSMGGREEITHTTIEKNNALQSRVIGHVMSITKAKGKKKAI